MSTDFVKELSVRQRELLRLRLKRTAVAFAPPPISAIPQADRSQSLPLSWAQQRLWFLDQLDAAAGAAYHLPVTLRLSGSLNRVALKATLDRIVARHENLRTRFVLENGEPVQRIDAAEAGFSLHEHDLSALPETAQQEAIATHTQDVFSRPFDLAQGPLIRGRLLRVSESEHILLINQHHIISDGWSLGVLVQEVSALYSAFSQGQADPLPALTIQYADYAAWQRQWLQGETLQAQIDYWKAHLSGAPELLALPTDRPRPAVQSYAGRSVDFRFSSELSQGLKQLSQKHGTTLFMTLLAGWGLLMSRLSGQSDVVIGSPIANRQRSEIENLIGFFVNTLALRISTAGDPSVAALLAQVKADTLGAYAHQDIPFEQVLEAVNPARSVSNNALFQTMVTLANTPSNRGLDLPGLTLSSIKQSHTATYCDLYLALAEGNDGIDGSLIYATDLFDESTVQRFLACFQLLLSGMVGDDRQDVNQLPVLDEAGRELQLVSWNRSEQVFPLEQTYASLFAEQVALHPQSVAVTCEHDSLTYRELDARASRVAQALLDAGAGKDVLVTLVSERNIAMLTMMIAVFKAGAAFLPLDIKHPVERLREIIQTSRSGILLVSESCEAQVRELAGNLPIQSIVVEHHWCKGNAPTLPVRGAPDDLAYVIFTSGSTGKPKGAMVEQLGMLNHMFGKISTMDIAQHDILAETASPAFDICVWQFLSALLVGGRTIILPDVVTYDPAQLLKAVNTFQITLLQTVPSMLRHLLDDCPEGTTLNTLRYLIPTGEALTNKLCQDWFDRFPDIPLMNVYGPAECSDDVTWHAITSRPHQDCPIPIGRPTPNNRIYILDKKMQPVVLGVKGEICVDGLGVGRGYLHNPEQTSAAFVPHPFVAGQRFYRTGDVGRYRPDGVIEFHGRLDFQVKIRGFRIELGEIEARLVRCAGVKEAVVLAREDQGGNSRLVAYLTGAPSSVAELRREMSMHLADYMVPGAFVTLENFPLTANGKIDRTALPEPDMEAIATRPYEPPQGEVEETVARIWRELLGLKRVGRHDHFFELGGSSLVATQVVIRLRKALDIEVPLIQLFQSPILVELAEAVVVLELKKFQAADVDLATADIMNLSDEEIDVLLAAERELIDSG